MTPEEKAIELVDKFYFIEESQECDAWIDGYLAKKCALLAVDGMIEKLVELSNDEFTFIHDVKYYQEVKTEIEKL
jgi:hypothetical protein